MRRKPKYLHDCSDCVFLGHIDLHDLYYCPNHKVLRARYDHDELDCRSVSVADRSGPIFEKAYRLACAKGLIHP